MRKLHVFIDEITRLDEAKGRGLDHSIVSRGQTAFFRFSLGWRKKGSGLVYSRYSSWHLRSVNLSRHH